MINSYKLGDRVIMTGKVDFDDVFSYYKNAKVFVIPSILETFGIPIIEAAQHGFASIAC